MTDWSRKYLSDLAGVCKACVADISLSAEQQTSFASAHRVVKQFESLPQAGGMGNVALAVMTLCGACQQAYDLGCRGRSYWQEPCLLVRKYQR